ncbi:hypothetical protein BX600DRAFT_466238 [Xylariales sp. PMI_506]|nr:hypothetical protein BX600DRAFT_466238 [Xylariales sp. PMI_506]
MTILPIKATSSSFSLSFFPAFAASQCIGYLSQDRYASSVFSHPSNQGLQENQVRWCSRPVPQDPPRLCDATQSRYQLLPWGDKLHSKHFCFTGHSKAQDVTRLCPYSHDYHKTHVTRPRCR